MKYENLQQILEKVDDLLCGESRRQEFHEQALQTAFQQFNRALHSGNKDWEANYIDMYTHLSKTILQDICLIKEYDLLLAQIEEHLKKTSDRSNDSRYVYSYDDSHWFDDSRKHDE